MKPALAIVFACLAVLVGCHAQRPQAAAEAQTPQYPPPGQIDFDALERALEAQADPQLPDIDATVWAATRNAKDPNDWHERMVDAICSTCERELGTQDRTAALRRADEWVANGEVERPLTVPEGYALMRKAYAEVAAKHASARPYLLPAGESLDEDFLFLELWRQGSEIEAMRMRVEKLASEPDKPPLGLYEFRLDRNLTLVPDGYGPGVHRNRFGQPVTVKPDFGGVPGERLELQPDGYGPGIHSDQYGRPVREYSWPDGRPVR